MIRALAGSGWVADLAEYLKLWCYGSFGFFLDCC